MRRSTLVVGILALFLTSLVVTARHRASTSAGSMAAAENDSRSDDRSWAARSPAPPDKKTMYMVGTA